jgi:hypothetical protein
MADSLESLGRIEVRDLVLHTGRNEFGERHSLTVYYRRRTTLRSVP